MSYILDALKKSEAERNRGIAPSLLDVRQVHLGSRVAMWALVATLVINLGVGGFWFLSRDDDVAPEAKREGAPAPAQPDAIVGDQPAGSEAQMAPLEQTISPAAVVSSDAPGTLPDTSASIPQAASPVARPATNEMELANLTFSTHVYASDPTKRAVTLNGRRLVEGDTISPGVRLLQITETGVVVDVNGREVALEVLQDWR